MSALLSPTKPVRTRFKVPGEGAYELQMDLPPPVWRAPATTTVAASSTSGTVSSGSTTTSTSSATRPSAAQMSGSSLGLPRVTKLSFAAECTVSPDATTPATSSSPVRPPSPVGSGSGSASSLFSFRKLTSLGLGKLSSSGGDDDSTAGGGTTNSSSNPMTRDRDTIVPRVPPRIATSDGPRRDGDVFSDGIGVNSGSNAAVVSANNLSTVSSLPTSGVLAYNAGEIIVLLDLTTQVATELPLVMVARAAVSCHAIAVREGLRLVVGCVNGEVLYYSDVVAAAAAPTVRRCRVTMTEGTGKGSGSGGSLSSTGLSLNNPSSSTNPVTNNSSYPAAPPPMFYNRDGLLNSTRVVALRWLPGPPTQLRFAALHADGAIIIHDARQRPATASNLRGAGHASAVVGPTDESGKNDGAENTGSAERGATGGGIAPSHRRTGSSALGAVATSSAAASGLGPHEVLVTRQGKGKRGSAATVWQIGRSAATACDFSPAWGGDSCVVAVAGRDGYLRVVDVGREAPIVAFRSYFGALLCVAWSPDGRYVAAGGEDDLISIWSVADERLVARLDGHTSWVSSVAWDAALCTAGRYRLGSAGQDAKLLLWDFALDALHRRTSLRTTGSAVVQLRPYRRESAATSGTGSSAAPNGTPSMQTAPSAWMAGKLGRLRGVGSSAASNASTNSGDTPGDTVSITSGSDGHAATICTMPVIVPAPGRVDVPIVEPVVAHFAHGEPLTDVWFDDRGVFTADASGVVKLWSRPPQYNVPELSLGKGRAHTSSGTDGLSSLLGVGGPSDLD